MQPAFHAVGYIGDVNTLEEGGAFIMVDRLGMYDPELYVFDVFKNSITLCNVPMPRCMRCEAGISDNHYHCETPAWFSNDLLSVQEFSDLLNIEMMLCNNNLIDRAHAYLAMIKYHGMANFDESPLELSKARAKRIISRLRKQIEQSNKMKSPLEEIQ